MKYIKEFEFKIKSKKYIGKYIIGRYEGSLVVFKIIKDSNWDKNYIDKVENYGWKDGNFEKLNDYFTIHVNDIEVLKVYNNLDDAQKKYDLLIQMEKYNI